MKRMDGKLFALKVWMMIGLVGIPFGLTAQQIGEKLLLSLQQSQDLAVEQHPVLAASQMDVQIDRESTAEARLKRMPLIYGDANLQRNLIIPVTPVPANAFDPSAPEGELRPLRFTTQWTSNAGVNGSFDLFNPQKKGAVQEARIREQISRLEHANTVNELVYEAGMAYLSALIAAEQLRLATADTLTQNQILAMSQQQFDEGRLLLSALNQVKADRNSALNNWEEARQIFDNNKTQLLYAMGYAPDEEVDVEFLDDLESLFQAYQGTVETDSLNSLAYDRLLQNKALLASQIQVERSSYLPSLTFNAYYGANYFDNSFGLLKSANWNGNSFVNVGLRLPISEGFERQRRISRFKLQQQADELRYEDERNKNRLDYLAAKREASRYQKSYGRARENFLLAEQNLQLAKEQFDSGRLLIGDLSVANYNYQREKNNYLTVAYHFISAKLNMERLGRY
jgi:outer membrane protein